MFVKAFLFKIAIYAYVTVDDKTNSENVTAKEVFTSDLLYRCKRMSLRFTKYVAVISMIKLPCS